jgi:iron(III) transport system substrate-binding protein
VAAPAVDEEVNLVRTRHLLAIAVTGIVLAGVAACGDDAHVPSDRKITVYSGRSESLVKSVFDAFQQQTGITVEVRYGDTAQMAAQLLEEGDKTRADVFLAQDAGALGAVAKRGLFAPLPAEVLQKVPAAYRSRNGEWVGVTGRSRVLAYNVDQVPADTLPTSVFELTGPQWKDKVGIAPTNGSFQAFVTALRVQHGDEKAAAFLRDLKANGVQIRENNVVIVADINAGKLATGLVNHYYVFELAKEQGTTPDKLTAQLHFFPGGDTGGLVNVSGIGVLQAAAADPDVRTFVDYLLGSAAQTHFAQQTFEYPLVSGVPAPTGLPALDSLAAPPIDLNDLDTLAVTVQMIKDAGLA